MVRHQIPRFPNIPIEHLASDITLSNGNSSESHQPSIPVRYLWSLRSLSNTHIDELLGDAARWAPAKVQTVLQAVDMAMVSKDNVCPRACSDRSFWGEFSEHGYVQGKLVTHVVSWKSNLDRIKVASSHLWVDRVYYARYSWNRSKVPILLTPMLQPAHLK